MKKYNIIQIIIWSVIILLLLAVLLIGLNDGFDFFKNTINFGSSSYVYSNSELYSSDITEQDLIGMNGIDTIIIDWISGNVSIRTDSSDFSFYEESRTALDEVHKLHWMRDGSTIYIRYCGVFNKITTFNLLPEKDLYINIPESAAEMIHILNINTISAPVNINGGVYKDINIETISGGVLMSCSFECLDYKSVSGNLDADSYDCPVKINAESISGKFNLILNKNRSFSAKFNSISGSFTSDIDTVSPEKHIYNHVNDKDNAQTLNAHYNFETISGNVMITKGLKY